MLFNPEFSWESLSEEQIVAKTLRALRNHIKHLFEISPYYRDFLKGVDPGDIQSLGDFSKLPFTCGTSMWENLSCFSNVTQEHVVESVMNTGFRGKPKLFTFTRNDLERLAYGNAISLHRCEVSKNDTVLILSALESPSFSAMGCYRGVISMGANAVRAGTGVSAEKLKMYLDHLKPTVVVGEPSLLRNLGKELNKGGYGTENCSVTKLLCTKESVRTRNMELDPVSVENELIWGAQVFSMYGTTEVSAPYCDCSFRSGAHCIPVLVYTEIVDECGDAVKDGTPGELVATPFGVEGIPLVRFQTGDITFKIPGRCECGRNSDRIGPILGRKDQLIKKEKGVIFPLTLINALDELEGINDYVIVIEDDSSRSDRVSIHVATPASMVETISTKLREVTGEFFPVLISNVNTIRSLRGKMPVSERILDWRFQSKS